MKVTVARLGAGLRRVVALLAFMCAFGLVATAQQPVFRSSVDLVAVDVQVIDGDGTPIGQLGPDAFQVSINGKTRKVVSAQFIRHADVPLKGTRVAASVAKKVIDPEPSGVGRTFILAVDTGSFETGAIKASMDAAEDFVDHLQPADRVGLFVYPTNFWLAPTTQRAPVKTRLSRLIGEKQSLHSYYNLTPHEIVDITTESTNPFAFFGTFGIVDSDVNLSHEPVLRVQQRECPGDADCPSKIYSEGMTLATQLEHESELSLDGIESMLRIVSFIPGRKEVVLVSGGLITSDRLDGRPDVGQGVARGLGQAAAQVNATLYTIQVDQTGNSFGIAARRGAGGTDIARDKAMASNWLEAFSHAAGGKRIDVPPGGDMDFAFDRVLRETSGYYLLGVQPTDADRDGKPRELSVKVDKHGLTVRNRQWVLIPAKRPA